MTPSLLKLPAGCAFRPRCGHATAACLEVPQPTSLAAGRSLRCWHALAA